MKIVLINRSIPVTGMLIENVATHFSCKPNSALKMAAKMAATIGNHHRVVNY